MARLQPSDDLPRQVASIGTGDLPYLDVVSGLDLSNKTPALAGNGCYQGVFRGEQGTQGGDEMLGQALHLSDFVDEIDFCRGCGPQSACNESINGRHVDAVPAHPCPVRRIDLRHDPLITFEGDETKPRASALFAHLLCVKAPQRTRWQGPCNMADDGGLADPGNTGEQQDVRASH